MPAPCPSIATPRRAGALRRRAAPARRVLQAVAGFGTGCLALAPAGASALSCLFDRECSGGTACTESFYEMDVAPGAISVDAVETSLGPMRIELPRAEIGDASGMAHAHALGTAGAVQSWHWQGEEGFRMLTVDRDGRAWLSVHRPAAGRSLLYIGQCEDDE